MNGRSGLVVFFIFLLLLVIIVLQVLAMVQSDRLYERLNLLLDRSAGSRAIRTAQVKQKTRSADLPGEQYPGDEGDWLIWCLKAEPRTLNPISVEGDIYMRYVTTGSVFERLLEYDFDEVKLEPWLAESYEVSDDGLEISVKLRDDVYFSDGVPITTEDILFTYETIKNPGVDAADIRNFYDNFKEVVKVDDRVVKFIFYEPYWKTFEAVGLFEVLPKHIYEFDDPAEFNNRRSNPVGSGPYIFEKWDVGSGIVLRRNENYWGHKPKLAKIVFRFITNDVAALQALRANEVDVLIPTPEQFSEMSVDEKFSKDFRCFAYWTPGVPFYFFAWSERTPYFKDRLVRLAMTHIVDRETIVNHLLKGNAKIVTGPFYIYGGQCDPNVEPWLYDLEKARQLLDEAGWVDSDKDGVRDKDGIAFRFRYSYPAGALIYEQLAKLIKDEAAKVGVDVVADPYEWSVFIERLNNREFEAATLGLGGTVETDPYTHFHSSQIAGRGNNFVGFNNPEADAIIDEARRAMDENKRYPLYHRFHRLLHEEQPYTFLFTRPAFRFIDKRFENVIIHKLGLNEYEWYVPKEKQRYK